MEMDIGTKIQELVGNPDVVEKKSKPDRHRYFKRPGRGHNRDTCDACGDCGDILCCDSCPASFHLDCVDPPLTEEELPEGWQCRSCTAFTKDREHEKKTSSSELDEVGEVNKNDTEESVISKIFDVLIPHCRRLNPLEFKLPSDFACYEPLLPGTSKPSLKKSGIKPKNIIIEPDTKKLKRSTAVCYSCDTSARNGALIKCDFCPTYYHLDCLDPPLTTFPSGVWNCPLHLEPFMESKLLTTCRLSERLRIWEEGEASVEPVPVVLNFFTKVNRPGSTKESGDIESNKTKVLPSVVHMYSSFRTENNQPTPSTSAFHKPSFEVPLDKESEKQESNNLDLLIEAMNLESSENIVQTLLKDIHPKIVQLLAVQKILENPNLAASVITSSTAGENENSIPTPKKTTDTQRLTPTLTLVFINDGKQLQFRRRVIDIGVGGNASLDLSKYGSCYRIAKLHASLFYDQIKSRWELLNYSPDGTYVNNCLYGCDISMYVKFNESTTPESLREFKEIIDQRRNTLSAMRKLQARDCNIFEKTASCTCVMKGFTMPPNCWEGSAIIKQGDEIRMGCFTLLVKTVGLAE